MIIGRKKYDRRSCVGAQNYARIERYRDLPYDNPDELKKFFSSRGYYPVFIEQGGQTIPCYDFSEIAKNIMLSKYSTEVSDNQHNLKPCFIMGSESSGIPKKFMEIFDNKHIYSIVQPGILRSLNVASAFSIIIAELFHNMK
jgi:hypothetical protein